MLTSDVNSFLVLLNSFCKTKARVSGNGMVHISNLSDWCCTEKVISHNLLTLQNWVVVTNLRLLSTSQPSCNYERHGHTMTVLIDLRCSLLESLVLTLPAPARPCDLGLASNVLNAGPSRLALWAACLIAAADGGGGGRSRVATSPVYTAGWPRGSVTERRWQDDGVCDDDAKVAAGSSLQHGLLTP